MAGEYQVFFGAAYYHNRSLGPILSVTFIFLMNLVAFSIIIAMVEDAYEIAKARGRNKKGLDPLLIQLILHARQFRNFLETLPCCPCIRKKFKEVNTTSGRRRRGLKRDTTVLDLIKGSPLVQHMSWWDLLYHEIINPYSHKKRLHQRTTVNRNGDVLEQEDNLHKARMLLIEKTVLEILMRMSNSKDNDEVITLEDVTQVHFANMQKERANMNVEKKKELARINSFRTQKRQASTLKSQDRAAAQAATTAATTGLAAVASVKGETKKVPSNRFFGSSYAVAEEDKSSQ
jgi:hypothetical protein